MNAFVLYGGRRKTGWMGAVVVLTLTLFAAGLFSAELTMAEKKKVPLDPAVEQALADLAEKGAPAKSAQFKKQMEEVIRAIDEKVHLTAEESSTLAGAADKAVEEAVLLWKPRFAQELRVYLQEYPAPQAVSITLAWGSANLATEQFAEGATRPDHLAQWSAAVKSRLGAERGALWEKEAARNQEKRAKEVVDYLAPMGAHSASVLDKDVASRIDTMTKACQLPAPQTAALHEARKQVVERIKKEELKRTADMLQQLTDDVWDNLYSNNRGYVQMPMRVDEVPEWNVEVKRLLTQEQLAGWEAAHAEMQRVLAAEIEKALQPRLETERDTHLETLKGEIATMVEFGAASPEHVKLLEAAGKTVVEGFMVEWQGKMIQSLSKMTEQQRSQVYGREWRMPVYLEGDGDARRIPAWNKKVDEILSPEERQRWKTMLAAREDRAAQRIGRMALAEMDKRVLLTTAQREKLEPVAREILRKYFLDRGITEREDYEFSAPELIKMLGGAKGDLVHPLLDESQWKRWQDGMKDDGSDPSRGYFPRRAQRKTAASAVAVQVKVGARKPEPPSVDSIVSAHLDEKGREMAARNTDTMKLRVEEAARIGSLPADAVTKLTTAAKGAVETTMMQWRSSMDRWVRQQVRDANAQNIRPRLEGMGSLSTSSTTGPQDTTLWRITVEDVMPAEKRKAWQQEQDARRDYGYAAMTAGVLRQVQKVCPVTMEEEKKLETLISKVVVDYAPDIQNWASGTWYLTSYYSMVPVAGVPEKDLTEALSPVRMKQFKDSVLPQAGQYWENIKEQHDQRVRNEGRRKGGNGDG